MSRYAEYSDACGHPIFFVDLEAAERMYERHVAEHPEAYADVFDMDAKCRIRRHDGELSATDRAIVDLIAEKAADKASARSAFSAASAAYAERFEEACSAREIRRASERAQWHNIVLPLIKAAGRNSGAVPEAR